MTDKSEPTLKRGRRYIPPEIDGVRVSMTAWLALRDRAGNTTQIDRAAAEVINEWAEAQSQPKPAPKRRRRTQTIRSAS